MKAFLTTFTALATALLLAGCVNFGGTHLVPGSSTAAQVEATMGAPAEKLAEANGDSVWFYPGGRLLRETYAVRMGANGVVRSVEQRLTEENIKKIEPGKTTIKEVRALMGPPYHEVYYPWKKMHSWTYPMVPGSILDWMVLWVEHDDEGIVRSAIYAIDPERNYFSTGDDRS